MSTCYESVIGIEIHVQMNTKSKMFCSCDNESSDKEPNINTCPICMGFPGTLPVLNKEAVKKGIMTALALNCEIPSASKFDRKNYFYPDLPKGYQISQYDKPISKNGFLIIHLSDGTGKKIQITRLHLEEDAGKLSHTSRGTLCDYNRSGTPLMEIVSEPDMRSIEEASLYARAIHRIVRAIETSEGDMEKGHLRFDINVSIRKEGESKLPPYKVEVKNLNSFRALEKALDYEIKRQSMMLDKGDKIIQETRGFDDDEGITVGQRTKEGSDDYRYFPEPDLPPLLVDAKEIENIKRNLPELPYEQETRLIEMWNMSAPDARLITSDKALSRLFEQTVEKTQEARTTFSLITILLNLLNEDKKRLADTPITAKILSELIEAVKSQQISFNSAKTLLPEMYQTGKTAQQLITEKGLSQISDQSQIEQFCLEAIKNNLQNVEDFKKGKKQALGPLVGYVMKISKGQANPGLVNEYLTKLLHD